MNAALELLIGVIGPVVVTALLASAFIFQVLRSSRRPRLFILWIIGLHALILSAVTLILIWNALQFEVRAQSAAQRDLRFDLILGTCMGAGVLAEGILIHLICRWRAKSPNCVACAVH